jgi:anti-sigma regulatory factor (Ser/Thr protein kinase)
MVRQWNYPACEVQGGDDVMTPRASVNFRPIWSNEPAGALADGAQVVVCDLRAAALSPTDVLEMLRPVARYLAAWPGAGVVVVCPTDGKARALSQALTLPKSLVLTTSPETGLGRLSALLPPMVRVELDVEARMTSARTSRRFVARSLLHWRLTPLIGSASLVATELVTNAVVHAASAMHITLSRAGHTVQLTVRDHGKGDPLARLDDPPDHFLTGRGLLLVQETARDWGVLPARPTGKTVWAVFDASHEAARRAQSAQGEH